MTNKSREAMAAELEYLAGTDPDTAPVTIYIAAEVTVGTADTPGTEVSAVDYDRLAVTAATAWSAIDESNADYSQVSNADDWDFIEPTEDWGEIQGWAAYDAPTGGTRLRFGELDPHQYIETGVILSIPAGSAIVRAG